jgi:hypothetical protein
MQVYAQIQTAPLKHTVNFDDVKGARSSGFKPEDQVACFRNF